MTLRYESIFAFDTETFLLGPGNVVPDLVCVSFCTATERGVLAGPHLPAARRLLLDKLSDPEVPIVGQNLAYDLAVICRKWPELFEVVFEAGEEGRLFDTEINEKLLVLSTTGFLAAHQYSLADLALRYGLGDRSAEKTDPNGWRLRYSELAGLSAADYPFEAYEYALQDAVDAFEIFRSQRAKATKEGHGSMNTAAFRAAARFVFQLTTAHGIWTDPEQVDVLERGLRRILNDDNLEPLYTAGVLRRPVPPKLRNPKAVERGEPAQWTAAKPASVDTTKLKNLVVKTCLANGVLVSYTDPSEKFPKGQVCTDDEVMTELAGFDPVLDKYIERQEVIKLQTTYLPNLRAGVVYPNYNVLVETGRTSSFKGKKGKQLYPSTNIQNQPRLSGDLSVRECYVARPGHLFCSVDYSALELCSFGQVIKWLYGHSTLLDQINRGIDPHAYLGAQICANLDEAFREQVRGASQDQVYERFRDLKRSDPETYKLYRTFAKPTGLGYPGGLGPAKFRAFAKATYGVEVDLATAAQLRDLWFYTYPEHRQYLQGINLDADPRNVERFCYSTPMGMYRAGATYCATANGKGLQSPSAEGALGAVWRVGRACYDHTRESILFGCRLMAFIHDEIILELPNDHAAHTRAAALTEIMTISMEKVLPDCRISAEPALMARWHKEASAVYRDGKLVVWEPREQAA